MAAFNKVILMGNLTRDPELRYTGTGTAVCTLGLAVNRTFKTQTGELREDPCFIDVTTWGKQAESCNTYLKKGAPVFVEGSLKFESWTDKTSGQTRSRHSVYADTIRFLGAPQTGSSPAPGNMSQTPQQQQTQSQPARATYQNQAPQQPQTQSFHQVNEEPSFQPPPMPEFEVESEDDIPF